VWGSEAARFKAFVYAPRDVIGYVREMVRGRPPLHLSHNPLGGVMVVTFLAVLLGTTLTGALVYAGPEWNGALEAWLPKEAGRLLKELHEALGALLLPLIGLHLAGVIASSLLERQNLVVGMITGWKLAPNGWVPRRLTRVQRVVGLAVSAGLALTAARLAWALFPIGDAHAANDGPRQQLAAYARAAGPGFTPSAERGEAMYRLEHDKNGKPVACATCHTADPARPGRTPAGKNVEPLAPSANPRAFGDPKNTEKWFTRNCKQVISRECTPAEKADFLSFLLTR
jgi:hypothetical protein